MKMFTLCQKSRFSVCICSDVTNGTATNQLVVGVIYLQIWCYKWQTPESFSTQRCRCQAFKFVFGLVTLTIDFLTPKLMFSCACPVDHLSQFESSQFICFQNILFTSLVTDEWLREWTPPKNIMLLATSRACWKHNKTRRALGRAHLPLTKVFRWLSE